MILLASVNFKAFGEAISFAETKLHLCLEAERPHIFTLFCSVLFCSGGSVVKPTKQSLGKQPLAKKAAVKQSAGAAQPAATKKKLGALCSDQPLLWMYFTLFTILLRQLFLS